tara:strand:- start:369 stop:1127 length:759 start_codon:yes stop_codon:yes gene_type:complete
MSINESIILGIIQGITEFLPISSSGHLVLVQEFLGIEQPGNEFEILLHIGTLGSILFVFFNDIKMLCLSIKSRKTQKFIFFIFVATLPAIIIGLGFKDNLESLFDNLSVVGFALIFTGVVLSSSYFLNRKDNDFSYLSSILIGLAQALAIIPGISRSGMTISSALLLGLSSKQAARFSFLLAIPVIGGAGFLLALDITNDSQIELLVGLAGLVSSFVVGVFSLKWLLGWLEDGKFHYFGIYCLFIGLLTIFI